jgi:acetyltransferase-like isoleucine patch superfamily enzyme
MTAGEVQQALRLLYEDLRTQMRSRWQRDLPLEELLFDRWERAATLGFGQGTGIYHNSYVYGDVRVGQNTWIGPFTLLDGSGGLVIGDYCSISAGVHIYTHDTVAWAVSGGKAAYAKAPVTIGNCCHIGGQTLVLKGVTIGGHSVVGACSLVNQDIPPYTIAFGTPCKPRGRVNVSAEGDVQFILDTPQDDSVRRPCSDGGDRA